MIRLLKRLLAASACMVAMTTAHTAYADDFTYAVTRIVKTYTYDADTVIIELLEAVPGSHPCAGPSTRLAFRMNSESAKAQFAWMLTAHVSGRDVAFWVSNTQCFPSWNTRVLLMAAMS